MTNSQTLEKKTYEAYKILLHCFGKRGVWADATRYRYQCWTRDFVLAIMPVLLDLGETEIVRQHLENLSKRQRPNGQIPILFLDSTFGFLRDKVAKSLRAHHMSFMLRRFFSGSLWELTPGTRDSEILYIIGMHEYTKRTGDQSLLSSYFEQIQNALRYIENNLMRDGLVIGCDWRDTMEAELGDQPLLTNNCLLYRAYQLLDETENAERIKEKINTAFWNGKSYIDYPGNDRFDPLGGALLTLFDIVPKDRYHAIIRGFGQVVSLSGMTIKCRHNPTSAEEAKVIEETDGVVVWPFIQGFSVLALLKINPEWAKDQFNRLIRLDGFREWYDPRTGKGYGAQEQLWSATLFLRAKVALNM